MVGILQLVVTPAEDSGMGESTALAKSQKSEYKSQIKAYSKNNVKVLTLPLLFLAMYLIDFTPNKYVNTICC